VSVKTTPRKPHRPPSHPAPPGSLWGPLRGIGGLRVLALLWREMIRTNVSLMASALAFYGLLATFPALVVVITSFALWADPGYVEWLMSGLRDIMPGEAWNLMSSELQALVASHTAQISVGLLVSLAIAMWSARSASASVMEALNRIYRTGEERGILAHEAVVFGFTLGGLVFGVATLAAVAVVPAILSWLPIGDTLAGNLSFFRWPVMALFMMAAFVLLYRFGPYRPRPYWGRILIGAGAATVLWLLGSALFSVYVARFGSYDKTYGSIGAVIVLLMWFYVSAYATLLGALLDAEMGRRASFQHKA
jgi:membrane protein